MFFNAIVLSLSLAASGQVRGPGSPPENAPVTFSGQVAPIVFGHCVSCHRAGEIAPFPLLTYADVKKHGHQIVDVTTSRVMPPWKAQQGAEVFHDARALTEPQIADLGRWVKQGMPEGNPADLPELPKFTQGWQLGDPDLVLEPSGDFHLPADGPDVYRCFVFPTNFDQDRYISAMEVRPGNRRIVHHAMGYVDVSGMARRLDEADPGPGYTAFGGVGFAPLCTLDGWGPGIIPRRLPEGVGMYVPKGADIVVQLHYHPTGKPESDRTRIGLYFCDKPVDKQLHMAVALNFDLRIPPNASHHEVRASLTIPADITLLRIAPHMHLLGHDIAVTATLPDGTSRALVAVPEWDFRWQGIFSFKEPVKLPKGSTVDVLAHFDNTADNPSNPSRPPREVTWGEGTDDEMCVAALFYTVDAEHLTQGIAGNPISQVPGSGGGHVPARLFPGPPAMLLSSGNMSPEIQARIAMKMFDKNGDGKLDPKERADAMKFIEQFSGGHLTPQQRAGAEQFLDHIGGKPQGPASSKDHPEPTTRGG
jgi:hypothetical protein